jgi:predicted HD phosphohydrolase
MNLRGSTENVGRVGHEAIGAAYLRSLGFSEAVCRLVNSHVAAKRYFLSQLQGLHSFLFVSNRYLTAMNRAYYDSLSSASQKSLAFQGGPFQGDELEKFDQDPLRDEMVSLRLWDDAAKLEGVETIWISSLRIFIKQIYQHDHEHRKGSGFRYYCQHLSSTCHRSLQGKVQAIEYSQPLRGSTCIFVCLPLQYHEQQSVDQEGKQLYNGSFHI